MKQWTAPLHIELYKETDVSADGNLELFIMVYDCACACMCRSRHTCSVKDNLNVPLLSTLCASGVEFRLPGLVAITCTHSVILQAPPQTLDSLYPGKLELRNNL